MAKQFANLDEIRAALSNLTCPDQQSIATATERNSQLTKPPGALGRLEGLAIWYAGWRGNPKPWVTAPQIVVFAGNHGVTAQGISAFPAEVTAQMVLNFQAGGAAINQLADLAGAKLDVHALQLDTPTADFTKEPAMPEAEFCDAFSTGWNAVDASADLLVVGEMGIGNTTSAAAIAAAVFGGSGGDWAGRGTGLDDAGVALKASVIDAGLALHTGATSDGLQALQCLGGREIAAMAGAISGARERRIPVILDGFIATSAAAALWSENPEILEHISAGHVSAEGAHGTMLTRLGLEPLLSLDLRLGEGSGAALAIQILKGALACHSGMATFAEAGVSDG